MKIRDCVLAYPHVGSDQDYGDTSELDVLDQRLCFVFVLERSIKIVSVCNAVCSVGINFVRTERTK